METLGLILGLALILALCDTDGEADKEILGLALVEEL